MPALPELTREVLATVDLQNGSPEESPNALPLDAIGAGIENAVTEIAAR